MSVLLLLGGLILIALGLTGEYVGRSYMTLSNLKQYRVREVVGQDAERKLSSCGAEEAQNG